MTPRERAKEATWDTGGNDWTSVDRERLEMAVEQAITAAVEEEGNRCANILDRVYSAWVEGDHAPGEAFESAKEKILYGRRTEKSLDELGEEYKVLNHLADKWEAEKARVIEEEREACLRLVADATRREDEKFHSIRSTTLDLMAAIRARSTASHSAEPAGK